MKRDDSLWKAVLEDTFDDFLRFFIPNADELFDFSKGVEYLDKELDQLFPPEGDEYKPRYVDKLVKVYTRNGSESWVLVHVEVQGYRDNHFAKRMFQYYTRIWDKYDRSIAAFAIFTDPEAGFRPDLFEQQYLGTTIRYTFNTYKILEQQEAVLAESKNPFSMVVLTVKSALAGRRMEDEQLLSLKLSLVRRLLNTGIEKKKIRNIMTFLRHYIRFENQEMNDKFDKELIILTNNNHTVMGTEEFLLYRARKEGREEGKRELIENLLRKGKLTVEQIAEILDMPVDFIRSIQRDLEGQ